MPMDDATTWLDVMPAIPLARAVPVVWVDGDQWSRSVADGPGYRGSRVGRVIEAHEWRVDLDDPQGFAYALRWLNSNIPPLMAIGLGPLVVGLRSRWAQGFEDDADRLALAKACAEVKAAEGKE